MNWRDLECQTINPCICNSLYRHLFLINHYCLFVCLRLHCGTAVLKVSLWFWDYTAAPAVLKVSMCVLRQPLLQCVKAGVPAIIFWRSRYPEEGSRVGGLLPLKCWWIQAWTGSMYCACVWTHDLPCISCSCVITLNVSRCLLTSDRNRIYVLTCILWDIDCNIAQKCLILRDFVNNAIANNWLSIGNPWPH